MGFPFKGSREKVLLRLPGQKRWGVLDADPCACLCLFHSIIYSLTALKPEAAQSYCRGNSGWSQQGEVGVCCLDWSPLQEPNPFPCRTPLLWEWSCDVAPVLALTLPLAGC